MNTTTSISNQRQAPREAILATLPKSTALRAPEVEPGSLIFFTKHQSDPTSVDLTRFATGTSGSLRKGEVKGRLKPRPDLILELLPAIHEEYDFARSETIKSFERDLASWWRLFDAIEEDAGASYELISVAQLTDVHRQRAWDSAMAPGAFRMFTKLANLTRRALGLREVFWEAPRAKTPDRKIPPLELVAPVWHGMKRGVFSTFDRWDTAEALIGGQTPQDNSEEALLANYRHYTNVRAAHSKGATYPSVDQLHDGLSKRQRRERGLSIETMYDGFFPNAVDVRQAFHLALAGSGWNPEPLLTLEVDYSEGAKSRTPFLEDHPSASGRYVMRGFKARGNSAPVYVGDFKTTRSPGAIIVRFVAQTWPLRQRVLEELSEAQKEYDRARRRKVNIKELTPLYDKVNSLIDRAKSPWLYISRGRVFSLTSDSFRASSGGRANTLRVLIAELNKQRKRAGKELIPYFKPSDFRDIFATYIWQVSGGSILHIRKALQHRRLKTSQTYIENNITAIEGARRYSSVTNGVMDSLKPNAKFDITLIAKAARDGPVTANERKRLEEYRQLTRSRLGFGCRDPKNPPREIDPNFEADGTRSCENQRCILCRHHGVLLPESIEGVAMRNAELLWLREHTPISVFLDGQYQEELDNCESAGKHIFDPVSYQQKLAAWQLKIAAGEHRPIQFQSQIHSPTDES